jgi:serine/threonine-protein kinase
MVPSTSGGYQPGHGYQGAPEYANVPPGQPSGAPADNQPGAAQPPGAYTAAGNPPGGAGADGGYQTADSRYGTGAPQGEQPPVDRYGNPPDNAAADAQAPNQYQPGATAYNPGQTGYNPPGVAPYQTAGQPNVVQPSRRNPYYRPGGTGDYLPTGGAASTADRYSAPPPSGDPNALPPSNGGIIVR